MAFMEVKIFCFANLIFMSSISSKNSSLLFILLFYSRIYENGFGELVSAADVLILRRSKHESPASVLSGYLLRSPLM